MVGVTGNSYATPVVTSIAAIVQSITGLQGAALKTFLTDAANVLPTTARMGGKRPTLLKTVAAALLRELPTHSDITPVMDSMYRRDGVPDPVGYMINRLRGNLLLSFEARAGGHPIYPSTATLDGNDIVFAGTWPFNPLGTDMRNFAVMMGGVVTLGLNAGAHTAQFVLTAPFRIGQQYSIASREVGVLASLNVAGTRQFIGGGAVGSLTYDACEMTRRSLPTDWFGNPQASGTTDRFVFLTVTGSLDAIVEGVINFTPPTTAAYRIVGAFTVPLLVINITDPLKDYLEQNCVGGFQR